MPRISAATVAEHREAQTRALLDSARGIIAETGSRPTLAEVAARAGLARSSVYQYFKSADELLFAVADDVTPRWMARIEQEMSAAYTPGERILSYMYANLQLVADGEHAIAMVLQDLDPSPEVLARAMEVHRSLGLPLMEALKDLGVKDVQTHAALISGVLTSATNLIECGHTLAQVWPATQSLLTAYVK